MFRTSVLVLALSLASSGVWAETINKTLPLNKIQVDEVYQINTTTCYYRLRVLDPATGEVRIQQYTEGVASAPRNAFLLGSSQGQTSGITYVIKNEIRVGMSLELGYGTTTVYERIASPEITKIERVEKR